MSKQSSECFQREVQVIFREALSTHIPARALQKWGPVFRPVEGDRDSSYGSLTPETPHDPFSHREGF